MFSFFLCGGDVLQEGQSASADVEPEGGDGRSQGEDDGRGGGVEPENAQYLAGEDAAEEQGQQGDGYVEGEGFEYVFHRLVSQYFRIISFGIRD